MPIRIICSACGTQAEAADALAGKSVQCPRCHAPIPVVAPKKPQPIRPQPMQPAQPAQPAGGQQPGSGQTLRPMNMPADDFGLGGPGSSSGGDFGLGGGGPSQGLSAGGPGLGLGAGIPSGPQGPQLFNKQVEPDTPLWQNVWVLVGGGAALLFILLTAIMFLNGTPSNDPPETDEPTEAPQPRVAPSVLGDPSPRAAPLTTEEESAPDTDSDTDSDATGIDAVLGEPGPGGTESELDDPSADAEIPSPPPFSPSERPQALSDPARPQQNVGFWDVQPPQIEPPSWTAEPMAWQLESKGELRWASQQGPFLALVARDSFSVWSIPDKKLVSRFTTGYAWSKVLEAGTLNSSGTRLLLARSQRAYEASQAPGLTAGEKTPNVFILVDASNGRVVREVSLPESFSITHVSWVHDEMVLARARQQIAVVDLSGQAEPWILTTESTQNAAAVSRDGSLLAVANGPRLEIYDIATRKLVGQRPLIRAGSLRFLSFSPDGSKLAAPGWSEDLTCWRMSDGKQLCQVKSLGGVAIQSGEASLLWSADSQCVLMYGRHIRAVDTGAPLGLAETNRRASGKIKHILPGDQVVVAHDGYGVTGIFLQASPLFTPELSRVASAVASGQTIEDARLPPMSDATWSTDPAMELVNETAVIKTPTEPAEETPSSVEISLQVPPGSIQAALIPSPQAQLAVVVSNAHQRLPVGEMVPQELAGLSPDEITQRIEAKVQSDIQGRQHPGDTPPSEAVVLDLASGRESGRWTLPVPIGLVDISPDGTRVLSLTLEKSDRLDVWSTQDGTHIQGWRPASADGVPDGIASSEDSSMETACFATNDIVIVHHKSAEQLSAWSISEAKNLWRVKIDDGSAWTLSPQGTYLHVVVPTPSVAMHTLETGTGKLVGRQPLEVNERMSSSARLAVHPNGQRFALNFPKRLWTWSSAEPKVRSVTLSTSSTVEPYWLSGPNNFVQLHEVVIQPDAKIVVWQLVEHHPLMKRRGRIERRVIMSRRADPRYWSVIDQSGQSVLSAQVLPDQTMLTAIPTVDPAIKPKTLWGPGVAVKLSISAGDDQDRVAEAWKRRLESQGMTVSDSAQTRVDLELRSNGSKSEQYVEGRFPAIGGLPRGLGGSSGQNTRSVSWTEWVYSINIVAANGTTLVSTTGGTGYSPPTSFQVQENGSMPNFSEQARSSALSGLMHADPIKGEVVEQPTGPLPNGEPVAGYGQTRFGAHGRHIVTVFSQNGAFWPAPKDDVVEIVKPKLGVYVTLAFEPSGSTNSRPNTSPVPSPPGIAARPGVPVPEQPQAPQWTTPDLPWPLGATETARDTSRVTKLAELLRTGDDEGLKKALMWSSKMLRPAISQRWGAGVVMDDLPDDQLVTADLQGTVGDVGRRCLAALQNAITQGKHGPTSGDGGAIVVLLEPHTRGGLLAEAQKMNLDVIGYFDLRRVRNDVNMQFRVVDVASEQTHWSSSTLNSREVAQAQSRREEDPSEAWTRTVSTALMETFALEPLPEELDADAASKRAELLGSARDNSPLAMKVAEIWLYRLREVLSEDETIAALTPLLGAEDARRFVAGTAEDRASVVDARFER
jgi:hypothetical protein